MKLQYEIAPRNILRIKVINRDVEQSWTLRQSHSAEKWAATFRAVAHALDPDGNRADIHGHTQELYTPDGPAVKRNTVESPERLQLRLQAEQALAGAAAAKAIEAGDESEVARVPEVVVQEGIGWQTSGFATTQAPSAAIDGTVYETTQYRKDRSNWVK